MNLHALFIIDIRFFLLIKLIENQITILINSSNYDLTRSKSFLKAPSKVIRNNQTVGL